MRFLITGCAGFIGYHVAKKILKKNDFVLGLDSLNNYYDVKLKKYRLSILKKSKNFHFKKNNLQNIKKISYLLKKFKIDKVIHLAAQPGIRHSLKKPQSYISNNLISFFNILEASKNYKIKHFIYASSSSVYGDSKKKFFVENQNTDRPIQLYAATKKSNEIIAESYSNIFKLKCTGLRFFSVYGPAGRPDMAIYKFAQKIKNDQIIKLYNFGNHVRDFTYIDDAVRAIDKIVYTKTKKSSHHAIYNIASGKAVKLKQIINILEKNFKKKSKIKYLNLQMGDVKNTGASIKKIKKDYDFSPKYSVEIGIKKFIQWFLKYNNYKFSKTD